MELSKMKYTVKRNVPKNYIIYIVLVFIFITFVILGASNVTKLTNDEIINLREFTDEIFLNDQYADFSYIIKNSFVTNVKTVGFVLLCSLSYPTSFLSALIIILKGFSVGFTSGFLIFVYNTKGTIRISLIPAGIEIGGKPASLTELMRDLCIQVGEGVSDIGLVWAVILVHQSQHRHCQRLGPGPSQTYIERGLSLPKRTFELQTAINEADSKESVIFIEVTIICSHIHHRRKFRAETGRKPGLIEVDAAYDIGVERREQTQHMADLIYRDTVQKKEIVTSVTAVHIESGQQFGPGRHPGQHLEGLDDIRSTEQGET